MVKSVRTWVLVQQVHTLMTQMRNRSSSDETDGAGFRGLDETRASDTLQHRSKKTFQPKSFVTQV